MIESAAYDIIKNEGFEEGVQQGVRRGLMESLADLLDIKFGVEGATILEWIGQDTDVKTLRAIIKAVKLAKSSDEMRKFIREIG